MIIADSPLLRDVPTLEAPRRISLTRTMLDALRDAHLLFSQSPIALSTNDNPEPDVFVTAQTEMAYLNAKPPATDIRLVIHCRSYKNPGKEKNVLRTESDEEFILTSTERIKRSKNPIQSAGRSFPCRGFYNSAPRYPAANIAEYLRVFYL